jgi:gliding motility-associated-like protein
MKSSYTLPTGFTPDGDGINDVWSITGKGFSSDNFKLTVFDRWGNQVFRSTNPDQVWTGNMNSGTYFVQNDAYVWILEVMDSQTGAIRKFNGSVSILR